MPKLGSMATAAVVQMITGSGGVNSGLEGLSASDQALVSPIGTLQVQPQNVTSDLAEASSSLNYPSVNVYCEKIVNNQQEKFRRFSGSVRMAIEVRHSQDRLSGLQNALELYADSITGVLEQGLGDWGNGMFYSGGYEVAIGAVKHGGKNFIQAAKITFQIGVSRN